MKKQLEIRRARTSDVPDIVATVRAVVHETYRELLEKNGPPPAGPSERWRNALVAVADGAIVGVGLASHNFVSDLWVVKNHRGAGAGADLLDALEDQIRRDGHADARLRVVASNDRAFRFYASRGWRETKSYPHERDGHMMIEMLKPL